jgi:hypothetical protein
MTTWEVSKRDMLRAAGWEIFHDNDERWCAVHAATGRIATIWVDYQKYIQWRDDNENFDVGAEVAAGFLFDCLSESHDHDKWLFRIDREEKNYNEENPQ